MNFKIILTKEEIELLQLMINKYLNVLEKNEKGIEQSRIKSLKEMIIIIKQKMTLKPEDR